MSNLLNYIIIVALASLTESLRNRNPSRSAGDLQISIYIGLGVQPTENIEKPYICLSKYRKNR